jgi:hypothetical protein
MELVGHGICFCVRRADLFFLLQSTSPSTTSWSEALKRIVAQQLRDVLGVLGSAAEMAQNERYACGISVWRGAGNVRAEETRDKYVQKICPRNPASLQERRTCMHKSGQACRSKVED